MKLRVLRPVYVSVGTLYAVGRQSRIDPRNVLTLHDDSGDVLLFECGAVLGYVWLERERIDYYITKGIMERTDVSERQQAGI